MIDINLPLGWSENNQGSALIAVVGGGTPSRKVPAYFDGTIPWFTVKDMKALKPNDAEEHISEAAIADSATNLIPANTLIVATRIALGRAIRPTVVCAINQDLKALVLGDGINPDFLLHWIGANERVIQDLGSGTTVSGIRLETLHGLPLLLPPSGEQTRIVEKLEELLSDLDAGVAELNAAQKKLGQYRQSLLKAAVEGALTADWRAARKAGAGDTAPETGAQLLGRILTKRRTHWEAKQLAKFAEQGKVPPKDWQKKYPEPVQPDTSNLPELPDGWVWASVDQLTNVLSGFAFKSTDFCSAGAPVTKIANIGYGIYESDTAQEFLSASFLMESSDFIVSGGDILIALTRPITNGTLKSCLYPENFPVSLLNQRVAALKVSNAEIAGYFYLLTRTPYFRERVRLSTSETLQPNMSPNALKAISVPLPPACESQVLVEATNTQLVEIDNQEAAIITSRKQSAAQRKNILKAAFSGQLVPQDPNDEPASALLERIRAARAEREVKKPRGRKTTELC